MKGARLVAWLLVPAPLLGQAVVTGTVRDDSTGRPLAGVEVLVDGQSPVTTDAAGRYVMRGVPTGSRSVLVRLIGYRPVRLLLRLTPGDTTWANVLLVISAQQLESVEVRVAPEAPRGIGIREEFEERRRMGFGKFIDSTVLRANEHRRMPDLLRAIPGLALVREREWECVYRLKKPSCPFEVYARGRRGCYMSIYVDGRVFYRSGIGPPPDWNREFYVHEYEAVEVYRSLSELPAEFAASSPTCGAIVLWTRRSLH